MASARQSHAVLRAGTGEAGAKMLAQGWRLAVGGESMIGQCLATGKPLILQNEGDKVVRLANPLLPETRSELALPLRYGERVIGAMTVQSTEAGAFGESDISVLQNLADQVAVAVQNAQLFAETQAALDRAHRIQRRYQTQAWSEYLSRLDVSGYELRAADGVRASDGVRAADGVSASDESGLPLPHSGGQRLGTPAGWGEGPVGVTRLSALTDGILPEVLEGMALDRPAVVDRLPVVADHVPQGPQLRIPLRQGGQVVGMMGIERASGWQADEIDLVQGLVEQLSLAAENQRLLDDVTERAAMERTIGEITSRVRAEIEVESVLERALAELARALDAERGSALLELNGSPEEDSAQEDCA